MSASSVVVDHVKIKSVLNCPSPKTLKDLRELFGLTSYYRQFVQGYGSISQPFTNLLKTNAYF